MTTETYKGLTNYETWNVEQWLVERWLEDDEALKKKLRRMVDWFNDGEAREFWPRDARVWFLAGMLEEFVEENNPLIGASMYSDLIGATLSKVNWQEIAENILII